MKIDLEIIDPSVTGFINADAALETLDDDCSFTEGPVWHPSGYYLFSDTTANIIYKLTPGNAKEILIEPGGTHNPLDPDLKPGQIGSNALAFDKQDRLLVCRHGSHDIAVYENDKLRSLVSTYRGKFFNSPNDLIIDREGGIYFSDPPYGLAEGKLNPYKYQSGAGVYYWKNGEIKLVCDKYQYPNGVCLSHDESTLYICSNKPFEKFVSAYSTATHSFIRNVAEENSDGIDCDTAGHLFLCNKDGLLILDGNGQRMAILKLPTIPSNLCWGGADLNDLFITARENVFLVKNFRTSK